MKAWRIFLRVLCGLTILAMPGLCFLSDPSLPNTADLHQIEQKIHLRVNAERSSGHIPLLNWNEKVAEEARRHAQNIAARHFFAHQDPIRGDIDVRLNGSRIEWMRCAENLYAGDIVDLAEEAVKAWRQSPTHRKNMLDSMFSEAGVGVALRRDGTFVVVQEFILK